MYVYEVGKRLLVVNLSDQSDVSDLLGGYKPINLKVACEGLMNRFGILLAQTFQTNNNVSFVEKLKKLFRKEKWKEIVNFVLKVCSSVLETDLCRKISPKRRENWKSLQEESQIFNKQTQSVIFFFFC